VFENWIAGLVKNLPI
jgi:hypothetical protein